MYFPTVSRVLAEMVLPKIVRAVKSHLGGSSPRKCIKTKLHKFFFPKVKGIYRRYPRTLGIITVRTTPRTSGDFLMARFNVLLSMSPAPDCRSARVQYIPRDNPMARQSV